MDVMNATDISNLVASVGIEDKTTEESPEMACEENANNLNVEDSVEEIADESTIIVDNSTIDAEPQVAEKIEVAVVTCANEENADADSSLEIFFEVNQEAVDDSTKVELQIEVDKTTNGITNEDKEEAAIEEEIAEAEKTSEEEDKVNLPVEEEEAENTVLTNGNASPTGDIIENGEIVVKPANETTVSLISDDIVILSDDECETATANKPENNEEKKEEESDSKNAEETVEKISPSAVTEILEDSNNSDSSNLLEISTVQEEREKERLQEKSGEEDEEYEEEDADAEVEDEETVTENDIEVVESNLDNEMLGPPPAKRSKLSEEKKDDEEQEQEQGEIAASENTVELNNLNESEIMTNQQEEEEENKTELNETSAEKPEEATTPIATATAAESEDNEMEIEPVEKLADSNELPVNGIELSSITNTKPVESVPLQFLRKFKKSFESMTRTELEELVSQKIIEKIVYQSQISELNKLIKIQEQITERHRNHISELSKQLRDLNMVHNRVLKDLEEHYSQVVLPVKITRAVGLQVSIPKRGEAASITAAKNEQKQQQQQQVKQTAINNEEKKTFTPNNNNTNNNNNNNNSVRKLNKIQTPTTTPFAQAYTQFDANKPSTSNAAKEAAAAASASALQIRKINITTPLVEDTNKKQNSSTKEVLPTTSIPATVYNMQNYMSSLNQLSAGAITITPAKPKEKECIDLTEDDDCIVMPATTKDTPAPALTSHILSTSQVYRQRVNVQSTIVNPTQQQVKNQMRIQRPLYGVNTNTNVAGITGATTTTTAVNLNATNNLNANSVARKSQPTNMSSYVSPARNVSANVTAPPLVMIPANTQSATSTAPKRKLVKHIHPAPLPYMPPPILKPEWKRPPPRPSIRINTADEGGIVISWTMDESEELFAECVSYQIYAYQQTSAQPQTEFWRYVGDVKAMLLPMAVTLTQFQEGQRYFFAVRAVDVHKRFGPFSAPKTWT